MIPSEIESLLSQSLEDHRLSRNEKQALGDLFARIADADARAAVSRRAFDRARVGVRGSEAEAVLGWLEEVLKRLQGIEGGHTGHTLMEAHFSPGQNCPRRIASLFEGAKRQADVCVFTITDDRISSAMLDAHRRGVALRIVTDNDKAGDEGSDIDRLHEAGIPIRVDRSEYHMHHKFAIFDAAVLLTGSYNWTRGASNYNNENFIVTDDPRLTSAFAETFERLWSDFA